MAALTRSFRPSTVLFTYDAWMRTTASRHCAAFSSERACCRLSRPCGRPRTKPSRLRTQDKQLRSAPPLERLGVTQRSASDNRCAKNTCWIASWPLATVHAPTAMQTYQCTRSSSLLCDDTTKMASNWCSGAEHHVGRAMHSSQRFFKQVQQTSLDLGGHRNVPQWPSGIAARLSRFEFGA